MTTTTSGWTLADLLAGRRLADVLGHDVDEAAVALETVPYAPGSPATGGLLRLRGGGARVFVKVLQHVRHWPYLRFLPPAEAAHFVAFFPWSEELAAWRPHFVDRLPAGLRVPRLYEVVDLGDDRVAVWMEDVDVADVAWDVDRYARAAWLLGAFNARMCEPEVLATTAFEPDYGLRMWVENALEPQGFAALEDDAVWSLPAFARHPDVRAGLRAARPLVPGVLARFATLRHGMPHGDASPQNLLVPAADPAGFVVIDIGFQTPAPLGFDLSQLVVGLAHAGLLPASALPDVERAVVPAYADGVRSTGTAIEDAEVAATYAGALLVRSGFTALPYREAASATAGDVDERADLVRFVLGAADRHLATG